jgi:CheY-like chemotaxis protein
LLNTLDDTGIGITDEAQKELFQPFSQGDLAYSRIYGGSGLGLALSKRISESLKGALTLVKSKINEGSVFKFCVPVEISPENPRWITHIPQINKNKKENLTLPDSIQTTILKDKKILLAEDSKDNQEIFQLFLESAGAEVSICESGLDVLKTI